MNKWDLEQYFKLSDQTSRRLDTSLRKALNKGNIDDAMRHRAHLTYTPHQR